ncbi:hypothetical protein FB384_004942 [Prauserella sediminis]|uniref:Uncharacterized protein n=1 Tax=Prauserella sediminis TaxID=577680 RepID=A0A839Y023_9PSEU|nr:hypothetical protein [Prauserella sediminis]MBB3665983.1 hypothetical protein [Prauserella sediminis]
MSSIDIPDEALTIATSAAREQGMDVKGWLMAAISQHAAEQEPISEIPVDDCGFPASPAPAAA